MSRKKRILDSVRHKPGGKIPLMYRALPGINKMVLDFFHCDPDISVSWETLIDNLGADCFSGGGSMSKFTRYNPRYTGPNPIFSDSSMFYVWGIYPEVKPTGEIVTFSVNTDFARRDTIEELKQYAYPTLMISPDTFREFYLPW